MSFEIVDLENSPSDSFGLEGSSHAIPFQAQLQAMTSLPSASRTLPALLQPVPFFPFSQLNRSQNLNIFSPTFDQPLQQSLSQASSRTSLVETSQRKNQAPKWRPEEDQCLIELVGEFGAKKWKDMALQISQKTGCPLRQADAVSQRWSRVINPTINKSKWSPEEIQNLINAVKECQPKQWKEIADKLPGRTDIQVRYQLGKIRDQLIAYGIRQEFLPQ